MGVRIIDLSVGVTHGSGRFGQQVNFQPTHVLAEHGFAATEVTIWSHMGTHVDAPTHFIEGGRTIDQVPLEWIVGEATILDFSTRRGIVPITAADLQRLEDRVRGLSIVLLRTGWTDMAWGTERFFTDSPYLSEDGAEWLVDHGFRAVGYDFSQDPEVRKSGSHGRDYQVHHIMLGQNVLNVEFLTNLGAVRQERFLFVAAPLRLVGVDGAPCRAFALEGGAGPVRPSP
ncbi:MAG: cyclase family protein [Candidatus Methylomirabilia bacterium]